MKDIRSKLVIGGLFAAAVIVGLLLYTDVRDAQAYIRHFPLFYVVPVLALTLFNYVLRWVKWQYYLWIIGVSNIKWWESAALWVSGFVLALSPGKVAELLKAVILRSMTGTPVARSAPVIVAERISDGLAMLVLGAVGFGGMLLSAGDQSGVLRSYIPAYLAVLVAIASGIIIIQVRPLCLRLLDITCRLPAVGRFSESLRSLYESSYDLLRPRALAVAVSIGVISWAGECVGFYLILRGMGERGTWLLLWQAMFMLAAATIIGAVSGLPGGLGAAEFTVAGLVQVFVLGYEDAGYAGTVTILIRLSTLWFAVLLGLLASFIFRRRLFPRHIRSTLAEAQNEVPS